MSGTVIWGVLMRLVEKDVVETDLTSTCLSMYSTYVMMLRAGGFTGLLPGWDGLVLM